MTMTAYAMRNRVQEKVTFEGKLGRETDKAVMFTLRDPDLPEDEWETIWFPLSQVFSKHNTRSVVNNTWDKIVVSLWIAKQKGLV